MTMPDGPMLMGIAAVITSLGNLAATLIAAHKRNERDGIRDAPPRRVPKRRSRVVARERQPRRLR